MQRVGAVPLMMLFVKGWGVTCHNLSKGFHIFQYLLVQHDLGGRVERGRLCRLMYIVMGIERSWRQNRGLYYFTYVCVVKTGQGRLYNINRLK